MTKQLFIATRKGLFILVQTTPGQWQIRQRSFLGEPVTMVLHDPHDNSLYAALNLGHFGVKLHRSEDEGNTWQEVATPSYKGLKGEDEEEDPSLELIWSLESDAQGTLWAGTIPGGLFKSQDQGQSWQLIENLWNDPMRKQWFGGGYDKPGIHSICIDPRDKQKMAIAVSCGGVWLSDDGGENWRVSCEGMVADYMPPDQANNPAIQDPHRMVQCTKAPDTFWVQHHNGIFLSTDRCHSWQRIFAEPSSFGFAVVVHPDKPEDAWFAPAIKDQIRYPVDGKFLVSKTSDFGATFQSLTSGLPEEESYDLIYRHALAIDDSGESLAMGSTTGNVWTSSNGGEQWSPFSCNFPPVYTVKFF